jgi:cobalt-zinc-cadmium efflux system outer membrane protein
MRACIWIALSLVIALPAHGETQQTLSGAFAAAWERQPEAQALGERQRAAQARQEAASALTAEPPSLELGGRSDRFNRDRGAEEYEVGLVLPLWLPGERRGSQALAAAEGETLTARAAALRLQLAGELRQAWWGWQLANNERLLADERLVAARRLRDDVAKRVAAGDLARADQHQADGEMASAAATQAETAAQSAAAAYRLQALTGQMPGAPQAIAEAELAAEEEAALLAAHPRLRELAGRGEVSRRELELARSRSRANPEITIATRRERGLAGEAMEQTWALGVRIPFSSGPRQQARLAEANAELIESHLSAEREGERLVQEVAAARSRLGAARIQLAAASERARLAGESREFFAKSFRLGESDLPTRLRIEQEAFAAASQAARARINLAASLSAYRQALGLLPE